MSVIALEVKTEIYTFAVRINPSWLILSGVRCSRLPDKTNNKVL